MKKTLLLASAIFFAGHAFSQNQRAMIREDLSRVTKQMKWSDLVDISDMPKVLQQSNPTVTNTPLKRSNQEAIIGFTTYDLQTNSAIQNRVYVYPDEKVSAVWITSNSNDEAAADRGTGYNHFDGSSWVNGEASYVPRLETQKTGWPSIFSLGNKEGVIAHTGTNTLAMSQNTAIGSTTWNTTILPNNLDSLLWPRAMASVTGDTIHLFGLTIPTGNQGMVYMGLDGAMTYSRSTDGGATWGIQKQILPGMEASDGYTGFGGDAYAMAVKGNTVALFIGDQFDDAFIMKSTDGGDSWNKIMVWDFPMTGYAFDQLSDHNNDGVADTINSCDGSVAISLDNSGMAHVFTGYLRWYDNNPGDGYYNIFTFSDGLLHWKEGNMQGQFDTAGYIMDVNGNGTLDLTYDSLAAYRTGVSSMPTSMVDTNGDIYMFYSTIVEGTDEIFYRPYRNIYGVKSTDGGMSWSVPVNVTPSDFDEAVYPTLGNRAPNYLHLTYQRDQVPGIAMNSEPGHSFGQNEIVYLELNKAIDVSVKEEVAKKTFRLEVYPNPARGSVRVAFENTMDGNATVSLTNILGATVASYNRNITAGENQVDIDLSNVGAGVYFVTVQTANGSTSKKLIVQ